MFGLKRQKRKRDRGSSKGGKTRHQGPIRTARSLFHGIAVVPDPEHACDAVREIAGVRFLTDEAPRLPLAACTNSVDCHCRYQHFDDRRTDARRESDIGLPMKGHPDDHRNGVGRRVTDG